MLESPRLRIDFDEWQALADADPEAFEARRRYVIEELIRNAPADRQQRLRRLQWRIDQIRRTSATPMAACLRLSRMMWDSVVGDGGLLEVLQRLGELDTRRPPAPASPPRTATVIPFPSRRGRPGGRGLP